MKTRNMVISIIIFSWIFASAAVFNPAEMEEGGEEYQKAYSLILDKQWDEAGKLFKKIIVDYPDGPWVDDSNFWLCYTLEKKGAEPDEAFECYQLFVEKYQSSKWVSDAKSNMIRLAKELDDRGRTEYTAMVGAMQKNEQEEITMAAIQALQGRGDEKSFNILNRLYDQSEDITTRKKIIYVFGTFDSNQANKKLQDIVKNESESVLRSEAIFWIGQQSSTEETVILLKDIVNNDSDYAVRKKAIFSLAQSEHKSAHQSLIDIAKNNDNDDIRAEAVFWLSQSDGSDETLELLKNLVLNDKELKVRKKAIFALSRFEDDKGFSALVKIAREAEDDAMRIEAVFWISQTSNPVKALEVLKKLALNDKNIDVQKKAVFSLSQLPSEQSYPVIKSIAENHPNGEMRQQAIFWIGQFDGNPDVLDFLKKIVYEESDPAVKDKAVFAIGQLSEQGGIGILIEIAQDHPNLSVRKKAIFWLGQSENEKAKEALEKVLFNE